MYFRLDNDENRAWFREVLSNFRDKLDLEQVFELFWSLDCVCSQRKRSKPFSELLSLVELERKIFLTLDYILGDDQDSRNFVDIVNFLQDGGRRSQLVDLRTIIEKTDSLEELREFFTTEEIRILRPLFKEKANLTLQKIRLAIASNLQSIKQFQRHMNNAYLQLVEDGKIFIMFSLPTLGFTYKNRPIIPVAGIPMEFDDSLLTSKDLALKASYDKKSYRIYRSEDMKIVFSRSNQTYYYCGIWGDTVPLGSFIEHLDFGGIDEVKDANDIEHFPSRDTHPIVMPEEHHLGYRNQLLVYYDGLYLSIGFLPKFLLRYFKPIEDEFLAFQVKDYGSFYVIIDSEDLYYVDIDIDHSTFVRYDNETLLKQILMFYDDCMEASGITTLAKPVDIEGIRGVYDAIKAGAKVIRFKKDPEIYIDFT